MKRWTMWLVAPLSRIQPVEPMFEVLTLEEKTEYSKDGENQIPDSSWPWEPSGDWVMMLATWLLGHMWFTCQEHMSLFMELVNPLTKHTLLLFE